MAPFFTAFDETSSTGERKIMFDIEQETARIIWSGQEEAQNAIPPRLGPTSCKSPGVVPAQPLENPWKVIFLFLGMMAAVVGLIALAVFPESDAETIRQWAISWLP